MKARSIQTKLIDSNKADGIKWKPCVFKQSQFNKMKAKYIQRMLIDSNKVYLIKWIASTFEQS